MDQKSDGMKERRESAMVIIKWRSIVLAMFVLVGLVVLMSGCSQNNSNTESASKNDPYAYYNRVQMNQTKAEIDAMFGVVPTKEGETNTYRYSDNNTGYGVVVDFDDSNMISAKTVYYMDEAVSANLSNAKVTEGQVAAITKGMTYNDVKTLLGSDGVEINRTQNPVDKTQPINVWAWINDDNSTIMVVFTGDKGIVDSAQYLSK